MATGGDEGDEDETEQSDEDGTGQSGGDGSERPADGDSTPAAGDEATSASGDEATSTPEGEATSASGDETDQYEVTTWENRTAVDHLAVGVYGFVLHRWEEILVGVAVVLLVAQFAIAAAVVAQNPWVLGFSLLSTVPAVLLVLFIRRVDPEKEPLRPMAVTFALGGLFASFAALLDSAPEALFGAIPVVGMALFFVLFVGPVEETVKWAAVRLYAYDRDSFDAVVDGAVYGAAAGLGFATVENAVYITKGLASAAKAGSPVLAATFTTTAVRSLAGPGHVIYAAFSGYYLGLAKYNPENRGPIVVKGLLVAALIHAGYDTLSTYLPKLVPFTPLVLFGFIVVYDGVFGYALYRKLARYRSVTTAE